MKHCTGDGDPVRDERVLHGEASRGSDVANAAATTGVLDLHDLDDATIAAIRAALPPGLLQREEYVSIGDTIRDVIGAFGDVMAARAVPTRRAASEALLKGWPAIVGVDAAKATEPIELFGPLRFDDVVLLVRVESAALANHLAVLESRIVRAVNATPGGEQVTRLRFRVKAARGAPLASPTGDASSGA